MAQTEKTIPFNDKIAQSFIEAPVGRRRADRVPGLRDRRRAGRR